jgi:hypothetical protein
MPVIEDYPLVVTGQKIVAHGDPAGTGEGGRIAGRGHPDPCTRRTEALPGVRRTIGLDVVALDGGVVGQLVENANPIIGPDLVVPDGHGVVVDVEPDRSVVVVVDPVPDDRDVVVVGKLTDRRHIVLGIGVEQIGVQHIVVADRDVIATHDGGPGIAEVVQEIMADRGVVNSAAVGAAPAARCGRPEVDAAGGVGADVVVGHRVIRTGAEIYYPR